MSPRGSLQLPSDGGANLGHAWAGSVPRSWPCLPGSQRQGSARGEQQPEPLGAGEESTMLR